MGGASAARMPRLGLRISSSIAFEFRISVYSSPFRNSSVIPPFAFSHGSVRRRHAHHLTVSIFHVHRFARLRHLLD